MTSNRILDASAVRRSWRRDLSVLLGLLAFATSGVVVLRMLPYSTSWIERADEEEVLRPPTESFRAGPLVWSLPLYRSAPELQPFRDTFGPRCSALLGVQAARCVTDLIKAKSPSGEPSVEFVDAVFNPSAALAAHMDGAPGHCTTRSAMTAVGLLSLGVPARIVQVLPQNAAGHNLVEVWDPAEGWLLFDPLFDSSYLVGSSFVSAVALTHTAGGLHWRRPSEGQPDISIFAGATIHYPEPWLYTRVGVRAAHWPFRGSFAQVGPSQFRFGPAQKTALGVAVVFGALTAVWTLRTLTLLRRRFAR